MLIPELERNGIIHQVGVVCARPQHYAAIQAAESLTFGFDCEQISDLGVVLTRESYAFDIHGKVALRVIFRGDIQNIKTAQTTLFLILLGLIEDANQELCKFKIKVIAIRDKGRCIYVLCFHIITKQYVVTDKVRLVRRI